MTRGLMKTASSVAVAAAAGLFATSAMAADLGGNCCADLEERVAELEATAARKGNRKVSLTVYGQVNKELLWHDDDFGYREGKVTVRDNDAGMSRFGFRGEAQIRPDFSAGYVIEIGLGGEDFGQDSSDAFLIRHNYVFFRSDRLGRLNVGQTSQTTDGLYEINLANVQLTPGGMDEHSSVLNPLLSTFFSPGFDGSRRQGVYYSTPSLAGFMLSTGYSHGTQSSDWDDFTDPSLDSDSYFEVALRYAGEFNGIRVAAGIGYRGMDDDGGNDSDTWMGSGSVMHTPTGLFVSGGYAKTEYDVNAFTGTFFEGDLSNTFDRQGYWVMAGIERNWFGYGATTLYGEYSNVEYDIYGFDLDGSYWGLGAVQKIDAAAMDVYLQYRNYEIDVPFGIWGANEGNVVTGGAIIRF